jgi:hypothetical protein
MIMTNLSVPVKVWVSAIVYISAIADEAAGWLVRFVHPDFAYFKIASFLVLEISLMTFHREVSPVLNFAPGIKKAWANVIVFSGRNNQALLSPIFAVNAYSSEHS